MKKILIVDDDFQIGRVYEGLLRSEGFEVDHASSAEEATERLLRRLYDLILLDINMPDIDGVVMREVLEEYDDDVKIIVASVYPLENQKRRIKNAHDYFDKSQGTQILLHKIKCALEPAPDSYAGF